MVGDKILAVMGQLMNSSPRSTPGSQHCVTSTPRSLPSVRNIIAEKEARKGGKEQQGKQNEAVCSKLKQDATQDLFKKRQRRGTANQVAKEDRHIWSAAPQNQDQQQQQTRDLEEKCQTGSASCAVWSTENQRHDESKKRKTFCNSQQQEGARDSGKALQSDCTGSDMITQEQRSRSARAETGKCKGSRKQNSAYKTRQPEAIEQAANRCQVPEKSEVSETDSKLKIGGRILSLRAQLHNSGSAAITSQNKRHKSMERQQKGAQASGKSHQHDSTSIDASIQWHNGWSATGGNYDGKGFTEQKDAYDPEQHEATKRAASTCQTANPADEVPNQDRTPGAILVEGNSSACMTSSLAPVNAAHPQAHSPVQKKYQIVLVASELAPYSQSMHLGEAVQRLSNALAALGHRVMVVSPRYGQYKEAWDTRFWSSVNIGGKQEPVHFCHAYKHNVDQVFVDHAAFLGHFEDFSGSAGHGPEWDSFAGNHTAFLYLCKAALVAIKELPLGGWPYGDDCIVIANDWQTALVPMLIDAQRQHAPHQWASTKTAFLCHDSTLQGRFALEGPLADLLGVTETHIDSITCSRALETGVPNEKAFVSTISAAVRYADRVLCMPPAFSHEHAKGEGECVQFAKKHADEASIIQTMQKAAIFVANKFTCSHAALEYQNIFEEMGATNVFALSQGEGVTPEAA